jgi:hypothetical protein
VARASAIGSFAGHRRFIAYWSTHLFSILVGFGVATLCATAFLFLMHMAED